jgi:hypothetical protein
MWLHVPEPAPPAPRDVTDVTSVACVTNVADGVSLDLTLSFARSGTAHLSS